MHLPILFLGFLTLLPTVLSTTIPIPAADCQPCTTYWDQCLNTCTSGPKTPGCLEFCYLKTCDKGPAQCHRGAECEVQTCKKKEYPSSPIHNCAGMVMEEVKEVEEAVKEDVKAFCKGCEEVREKCARKCGPETEMCVAQCDEGFHSCPELCPL